MDKDIGHAESYDRYTEDEKRREWVSEIYTIEINKKLYR